MTNAYELPKWRLALALAALFLSSMCTMGDLVISPIAADVYRVFSDVPEWLINLGITGPALFGLPFGLVAGFLCDRMDKRIIMLFGFTVFTLAAVFGAAVENVHYFVTMRLLATGAAWGITNTAALSILADLFTDHNEHGKYVGWYNAVMSIMGAGLAAGAGQLAVTSWQSAFSMYLVAVPVLVLLVLFLPKFPPVQKIAAQVEDIRGVSASSAAAMARGLFCSDAGTDAPKSWWKRLVPLTVQVFLVAMLYFVLLYMIALYVDDSGVGDQAFTGMLNSVMTLATAVSSVAFAWFYQRLRNRVHLPALFVIALAFFALAYFPSTLTSIVFLALAGLAWPLFFCYFYTRCTQLAPSSKQSTATSIVAAANGLAATACSFLLTGTIDLTGGTCLTAYPILGGMMLVVAIISLVSSLVRSNDAN